MLESAMLAWECFPRPLPALVFSGSARGYEAKTGMLTTVSMAQQYVHPRDGRESEARENWVKSQRDSESPPGASQCFQRQNEDSLGFCATQACRLKSALQALRERPGPARTNMGASGER